MGQTSNKWILSGNRWADFLRNPSSAFWDTCYHTTNTLFLFYSLVQAINVEHCPHIKDQSFTFKAKQAFFHVSRHQHNATLLSWVFWILPRALTWKEILIVTCYNELSWHPDILTPAVHAWNRKGLIGFFNFTDWYSHMLFRQYSRLLLSSKKKNNNKKQPPG